MERIVVGVDGSECSARALRWAIDEARRRDATLDVVHAWHLPNTGGYPYLAGYVDLGVFEADGRLILDRAVADAEANGAPKVEPILVQAGAARALLETAEGADLLVVGSRAGAGSPRCSSVPSAIRLPSTHAAPS